MTDPIVTDGSQGEGGGRIFRAALALSLSLVTGRPFRIENILAGRSKGPRRDAPVGPQRRQCANVLAHNR